MTSTADSPRRRPFARDDADAVIAFCAGRGPYDAGLVRRLVLELTSGTAGVFVIEDREGPALVATVVDRVNNSMDAASLETLGVRAPLTADAFMRLVIEPAISFVRGGERGALSIGLHAAAMPAAGAESALRAAGFAHAYDGFEMKRPGSTPAPDAPAPLPAGWSWRTVDAALADQVHAAMGDAFREAPSANRVPLDEFRRWIAAGASVYRALLDGDRVAGFVQIATRGAHGELRIVGRVPQYRGRGLGPRLVAEGLRLLREGGAGDVELSVEAKNDSALALYRRFGFDVVSKTPVFTLRVR
jgi:ribosomal protein S18 acetylase RimI-like enzyme